MVIADHNDAQNKADGIPRFFLCTPSKRPNRAKTKPKNAVDDKQKKVIQDSRALEVTVAAPPRSRLIAVTTNSARKNIPPELPTNWPMVERAKTKVISTEQTRPVVYAQHTHQW